MSNETRPNADELLAKVTADDAKSRRGRLKIFFGYAAGVGKTFAMLEAARREQAAGVDLVAGYVEPHGRKETESLLEGIETLPFKMIPYRGVNLREFDLDAALARKPQLILVDELAHTNAEGLRHAKRWQDVQELLEAGINVYTTLNVQHVESLNDVIARITGVIVRETLPDTVVQMADEVELVDISPEELLERLREGKIYVAPQAARALQNFFQSTNLVALRELALRRAADRLRRHVDLARRDKAAQTPWATNERILVCVSPSLTSAKIIRTAKRLADAFGAEWLAVSVETRGRTPSIDDRQRLADHFRLAEQLGAETHTLTGDRVADAIVEFARARNVTKIVVGKTAQPWWKRVTFGTLVDDLLEKSGDIEVDVIRGEPDPIRPRPTSTNKSPVNFGPYIKAAAIIVACGGLGELCIRLALAEANIAMIFLLGVVIVATRFGRGPSIFASVFAVIAFDFFFITPRFSLAVSDAQYVITFAIMVAIALLISALTARIREQLRVSQAQERRTAALYRLTKQLGEVTGSQFLLMSASKWLTDVFGGENVLYQTIAGKRPELLVGETTAIGRNPINGVVAEWVAGHGHIAGLGTDTLPNATALFLPLTGSHRTLGVIGICPEPPDLFGDPEQRRMLESCASLVALSLERDLSLLDAQDAELRVQTEQLRNSLLSSVSHDLRTPLATIAGSASRLLDAAQTKLPDDDRDLLATIVRESHRLTRLVENLLEMTRLQTGEVPLNREWHVLEEIVGSARLRLREELADHPIDVDIPADFPLLLIDGILIEQVFVNLLENAARYTPTGTAIEIGAAVLENEVEIKIADRGPGLPVGSERKVFEKFYRAGHAVPADGSRGVGLGLAICQAIVKVHGGDVSARNRPEGGAEFTIRLPKKAPPKVVG